MSFARSLRYRLANLGDPANPTYQYFGVPLHHAPSDQMLLRTIQEGIFESDTVATIREFLRPDSTYLDIGANLGLLSLPFLATPGLEIHSFEPEPSTFQFLGQTHSAARNPNWHLHELALGKEPGVAEFHHGDPTDAAYAGLRDTGRSGAASHTTKVTVATLDELWDDWGKPAVSVIKIDVEGGELDVFAGGRDLINTCRPAIISEIDPANYPAYGHTDAGIFASIQEMGYGIFLFPNYQSAKPRFTQIHSVPEFRANLRKEINYLLLPNSETCLMPNA